MHVDKARSLDPSLTLPLTVHIELLSGAIARTKPPRDPTGKGREGMRGATWMRTNTMNLHTLSHDSRRQPTHHHHPNRCCCCLRRWRCNFTSLAQNFAFDNGACAFDHWVFDLSPPDTCLCKLQDEIILEVDDRNNIIGPRKRSEMVSGSRGL